MKNLYLVFLLFGIVSYPTQAQEVVRNFTTLTYNKALQPEGNTATSYNEQISLIEQQISKSVRLSTTFQEKTIPIVFHILYANESQKVSADKIARQLVDLNNHFALSEVIENHPNDPEGIYAKRAIDTKIRFCLATNDGEGNPIEGVNYVTTNVVEWKQALEEIKQNGNGVAAINPNKLLNIWVISLPLENAGYAQMPGHGTMATDGIVINYHYFGETVDENFGNSKTLTFLTAQYLNLYPLSGHSLDFPCSDDFVDDTPRHNSRNNGCPSSGNHITLCEGNSLIPEMTMNFMSANTSDDCKYMFTRGQAARMQAILDSTGVRHDLVLTASSCQNNLKEAEERNTATINKTVQDEELKVYPNPANNNITIELQNTHSGSSIIEILTADGKLVFSKKIDAMIHLKETINISDLAIGFYLVKVHTNQVSLVQKLTIE